MRRDIIFESKVLGCNPSTGIGVKSIKSFMNTCHFMAAESTGELIVEHIIVYHTLRQDFILTGLFIFITKAESILKESCDKFRMNTFSVWAFTSCDKVFMKTSDIVWSYCIHLISDFVYYISPSVCRFVHGFLFLNLKLIIVITETFII